MSTFISVRGWLATKFELLDSFKIVIKRFEQKYHSYGLTEEQVKRYQKGWLFPTEAINWTSYIFFGADVKIGAENHIKDQIVEMLNIDKEIEGLFYFDDDGCMLSYAWEISDSTVIIKNREID